MDGCYQIVAFYPVKPWWARISPTAPERDVWKYGLRAP